MSPAAVLAVIVKTQGVTQANAKLATVQGTLTKTEASAAAASSAISKAGARTQKAGVAMSNAGSKINRNIGLPLALIAALSAKAAIDFEDSFADIRKTVNATEPEFRMIERAVRKLSKEIPISVNELNHLGGQAGALGIKSKSLVPFIRTAAELGTTTDLSADEASNALARLSNIMGTSDKDFHRMASTFVQLGNKGASTEQEIANMALRLAGTGHQVGLTEAKVLSFASALASVGIRAEAGGSAISKTFAEMASEVAKGGDRLELFAKVSGMSTSQFAAAFKEDAAGAMIDFMEGLDGIRKSGGNVFGVLEKLKLKDIRIRDSLLRAAGAGNLFREQLKIGSKEWQRNIALTKEAEKRYGTQASKMELAKNKVNDFAISLGQHLIPVVAEVVDILETVTHFFAVLPPSMQENILKVMALTVALGILLSLGGKLVQAYAQLPKLWVWLTTVQGANTAATEAATVANAELAASLTAAAAAQRELLIANKSGVVTGSIPVGGTAVSTVSQSAGKTGAMALATGLARFIPFAIAAVGLGSILSSAISGDTEGALHKAGGAAGGALIGGILGSVVPGIGTVAGALAGAGIGALLGGLIKSEKELHPLQEKLAEQSKRAAEAFRRQRDATQGLVAAEERAAKSGQHHKETTHKVTAAHRNLNRVVEKFGPVSRQAHEAELKLAQAERADAKAANAAKKAHELSKNEQKLLLVTSREVVAQEKARIPNLKAVVKNLQTKSNKDKNNVPLLERLIKKEKDLGEAHRKVGKAIRDVAAISPKQAQALRHMNTVQAEFGMKLKGLIKTLPEFGRKNRESVKIGANAWLDYRGVYHTTAATTSIDMQNMSKTTSQGVGQIKKEIEMFASQLGIKNVNFTVGKQKSGNKAGKHQQGGMVVPGAGTGDKVPMTAWVEPGEVVHVLNSRAAGDRQKLGELEYQNRKVRRFQSGGSMFVDPAGPGTGIVNRAIAGVVGRWSTRYNAAINYGYDPGGGHISPGHNVTGTATDTGPAAGWDKGTKMFETGLRAIQGKVDQILYGSHGIGEAYPNHGWGNHAHIEWGMHPEVQGMLGQMVAKRVVSGPSGLLRDISEAAINETVKMANKKLQELGGIGGGPDLNLQGVEGSIASQAAQIAKASGSPHVSTLALFEALWAESSMGAASPGNVLQALPPYTKIRPAAQEISGFLTGHPEWTGTAAIPLAGSGLPANAIAQLVQKSGVGEGNEGRANYLQQKSAALNTMSQFGLQEGGTLGEFLGYLKQGTKGKAGKGKGSPFSKALKTLAGVHIHKGKGMVRKLDRKLQGMGFDPDSPIVKRLAELTTNVEKYDEFANNASSLSITDDQGNTTPGMFKGRDEVEWLNEKLSSLMTLRRQLVGAHDITEKKVGKVQKLLQEAKNRLKKVRHAIAEGERAKKKIEQAIKDLEKARDSRVQSIEKEKKELERKLEKAQGAKNPNQGYIAQLRSEIQSKNFAVSHEGDSAREQIKQQNEKLRDVKKAQASRGRVESALADTLIPTLEGKRSDLLQTGVDLYGQGGSIGAYSFMGLQGAQGAGSTTDEVPNPPPIGSLGGEIFSVQNRLRELGEEAARAKIGGTAAGADELAAINAELMMDWKKRYLASQQQVATLEGFPTVQAVAGMPYAGAFALGGSVVAKVGERGAEYAVMPSGSHVVNNRDAKEAVAAGARGGRGPIELNFEEVNFYEDGTVKGKVNGETFDQKLKKVGRGPKTSGGKR